MTSCFATESMWIWQGLSTKIPVIKPQRKNWYYFCLRSNFTDIQYIQTKDYYFPMPTIGTTEWYIDTDESFFLKNSFLKVNNIFFITFSTTPLNLSKLCRLYIQEISFQLHTDCIVLAGKKCIDYKHFENSVTSKR